MRLHAAPLANTLDSESIGNSIGGARSRRGMPSHIRDVHVNVAKLSHNLLFVIPFLQSLEWVAACALFLVGPTRLAWAAHYGRARKKKKKEKSPPWSRAEQTPRVLVQLNKKSLQQKSSRHIHIHKYMCTHI